MDNIGKHSKTKLVGLSVAFTSKEFENRLKFTVLFLKKVCKKNKIEVNNLI